MSISSLFPNLQELQSEIITETFQTLKYLFVAGIISFIIGLVMALALILFRKEGLKPNKFIYGTLNAIINLLRALPFVILVFWMIPLTRLIVGSSISFAGASLPLIFSTAPFFARQFETAFLEIDKGVIEAALSMGLSNIDVLIRVYLKESLPGIVRGSVITLINLLGLITMIGVVGGGGIGNLAITYGQNRNMFDIINIAVIIILGIVYIIQIGGNITLKFIEKGE